MKSELKSSCRKYYIKLYLLRHSSNLACQCSIIKWIIFGYILMIPIISYQLLLGKMDIHSLIFSNNKEYKQALLEKYSFEISYLPFKCNLNALAINETQMQLNLLHINSYKFKIPNNIFQSWKTHKSTDCRPIKIIELNKNYNYYLYNDTEIEYFFNKIMINEFDSKLTKIYNMIDTLNGAARADIFRYSILWKYGGIWIDFDGVCFIPFDEMIVKFSNSSAIIYHTITGGHGQWLLMFEPKHVILTETINKIIYNILSPEKQKELSLYDTKGDITKITRKVTGPSTFSKSVRYAKKKYKLVENIDYSYMNSQNCKHYHALKGFYKKAKTNRYNTIHDRAFLKNSS
eukprot:245990_1